MAVKKILGTDSEIIVDDRTGSDRLGRYLTKSRQPVRMARLQFGDVAFTGNGPDGRPISIGIEYKVISDVLTCITDGRFAGHQLPGLVSHYEIPVLLIEGATRPDPTTGILQVRHPKGFWYNAKGGNREFAYRDLQHWIFTLMFKAGIRVLRTHDIQETTAQVISLFTWWTSKEWADHRSHLAMVDQLRDQTLLFRPTLVRRMAKELPGVGWDRSGKVSMRFKSVLEMVLADEGDWRAIDGIGPKTASQVCAAMRGEPLEDRRNGSK